MKTDDKDLFATVVVKHADEHCGEVHPIWDDITTEEDMHNIGQHAASAMASKYGYGVVTYHIHLADHGDFAKEDEVVFTKEDALARLDAVIDAAVEARDNDK